MVDLYITSIGTIENGYTNFGLPKVIVSELFESQI